MPISLAERPGRFQPTGVGQLLFAVEGIVNYKALAEVAGVPPDVQVDEPRVVAGEMNHEDERRFVWLINVSDAALSCRPHLAAGRLVALDGGRVGESIELPACGVCVLERRIDACG